MLLLSLTIIAQRWEAIDQNHRFFSDCKALRVCPPKNRENAAVSELKQKVAGRTRASGLAVLRDGTAFGAVRPVVQSMRVSFVWQTRFVHGVVNSLKKPLLFKILDNKK